VLKYIGITKRFAERQVEHAANFAIKQMRGISNLTRDQARGVAQVLINKYKLSKEGGSLENSINSIARANPKYNRPVEEGKQLLQAAGHGSANSSTEPLVRP
jgi:hypothetical protein